MLIISELHSKTLTGENKWWASDVITKNAQLVWVMLKQTNTIAMVIYERHLLLFSRND